MKASKISTRRLTQIVNDGSWMSDHPEIVALAQDELDRRSAKPEVTLFDEWLKAQAAHIKASCCSPMIEKMMRLAYNDGVEEALIKAVMADEKGRNAKQGEAVGGPRMMIGPSGVPHTECSYCRGRCKPIEDEAAKPASEVLPLSPCIGCASRTLNGCLQGNDVKAASCCYRKPASEGKRECTCGQGYDPFCPCEEHHEKPAPPAAAPESVVVGHKKNEPQPDSPEQVQMHEVFGRIITLEAKMNDVQAELKYGKQTVVFGYPVEPAPEPVGIIGEGAARLRIERNKPRPVHLERALRLCARLRRDSRAYCRKYNMEFEVELKRAYAREAINAAWMARKIYREVIK